MTNWSNGLSAAMGGRYQAFDTVGNLADDEELQAHRRGSALLKFDRNYIKPIFTSGVGASRELGVKGGVETERHKDSFVLETTHSGWTPGGREVIRDPWARDR